MRNVFKEKLITFFIWYYSCIHMTCMDIVNGQLMCNNDNVTKLSKPQNISVGEENPSSPVTISSGNYFYLFSYSQDFIYIARNNWTDVMKKADIINKVVFSYKNWNKCQIDVPKYTSLSIGGPDTFLKKVIVTGDSTGAQKEYDDLECNHAIVVEDQSGIRKNICGEYKESIELKCKEMGHTYKIYYSDTSKDELKVYIGFEIAIKVLSGSDITVTCGLINDNNTQAVEVKTTQAVELKTTQTVEVETLQDVEVTKTAEMKTTQKSEVETTKAVEMETIQVVEVEATEAMAVKTTQAMDMKTTQAVEAKTTQAVELKTTQAVEVETLQDVEVTKMAEMKTTQKSEVETTKAVEMETPQVVEVEATEAMAVKTTQAMDMKTTQAVEVKTTQVVEVKPTQTAIVETVQDVEVTKMAEVKTTQTYKVETTEAVEMETTQVVEVEATQTMDVKTTQAVEVKTTLDIEVETTQAIDVKTTLGNEVETTLTAKVKTTIPAVEGKTTQPAKMETTQADKVNTTQAVEIRNTNSAEATSAFVFTTSETFTKDTDFINTINDTNIDFLNGTFMTPILATKHHHRAWKVILGAVLGTVFAIILIICPLFVIAICDRRPRASRTRDNQETFVNGPYDEMSSKDTDNPEEGDYSCIPNTGSYDLATPEDNEYSEPKEYDSNRNSGISEAHSAIYEEDMPQIPEPPPKRPVSGDLFQPKIMMTDHDQPKVKSDLECETIEMQDMYDYPDLNNMNYYSKNSTHIEDPKYYQLNETDCFNDRENDSIIPAMYAKPNMTSKAVKLKSENDSTNTEKASTIDLTENEFYESFEEVANPQGKLDELAKNEAAPIYIKTKDIDDHNMGDSNQCLSISDKDNSDEDNNSKVHLNNNRDSLDPDTLSKPAESNSNKSSGNNYNVTKDHYDEISLGADDVNSNTCSSDKETTVSTNDASQNLNMDNYYEIPVTIDNSSDEEIKYILQEPRKSVTQMVDNCLYNED